MKSTLRSAQLWLHSHYDGVKLGLAVTTLFVLVIGLLLQQNTLVKNSEATELAVRETQTTAEQLKRFTQSVASAVDELKMDNKRQTVILCTIILRGNLDIDSDEEIAVQEICEQEVERALQAEREERQSGSSQAAPSNNSQSVNTTPPSNPEPTQPAPQLIEEQPTESEESSLCRVLSIPVLNLLKGIAC